MPPRFNHEGQYTDTGTVDQDGKLVLYTPEEIERTRAYEAANGIPSTLPADESADAVEALADESEDDSEA